MKRDPARVTLVTNAQIYTPEPLGKTDLLYCGPTILKLGPVDQKALLQSGLDVEILDAKGNILVPGIIDPHVHLLGGSGENGGFSSQTPEISLSELIEAGVTTVVGTLGADTIMKTMPGLLAKVKGLNDEGLSAHLYTGGYTVPPTTILKTAREDIMFIEEVIGIGEIAISDSRSEEPPPELLSRTIIDAHMGGMLSDKAGVAHFHVGPGKRKLQCLRDVLEYAPDVDPAWLYPTHINRNEELLREAIDFSRKTCFVDMDVTEGDLHHWLHVYQSSGGDPEKLTLSSDAALTSPSNLFKELKDCILHHRFRIEELWPFVSSQTAKALKFRSRGKIQQHMEPNFLILDQKSLDIIHVVSQGKFMIRDGRQIAHENFLQGSNREIHLLGDQVR